MEFIRQRTKVHLLDESYTWVTKTQDFAEDLNKEFGKSKVSGLKSVHETSLSFFYASRGRDSSYFGLFSNKGCLVVFYALRGYLTKFWGYGNSALF